MEMIENERQESRELRRRSGSTSMSMTSGSALRRIFSVVAHASLGFSWLQAHSESRTMATEATLGGSLDVLLILL